MKLQKHGHIKRAKGRIGNRNAYALTSPVFGQKQGKETIVREGPSGGRRYVSIAREEVA